MTSGAVEVAPLCPGSEARMRILFLNDVFPGRQRGLAASFAMNPANEVLFASSYCRQGFSLPGVRRVLLKHVRERPHEDGKDFFEREWSRALKVGRLTLESLLKLRESGFTPEIILSSSAKGHTFFVRRVFPKAFLVSYLDEFFLQSSKERCYSDRMMLLHLLQSASMTQSQAFFVFREEQKKYFPEFMRDAIGVVPVFVDTEFFSPACAEPFYHKGVNLSAMPKLVSFSVAGLESARSKGLWSLVMALLNHQPQCHVVLSGGGAETREQLESVASRLCGKETSRLHIMDFLPLREYRDLLCASTVHVRLETTDVREGELLEIMSCETLLLTPLLDGTAGFLRNGENMVICSQDDPEERYRCLSDLLRKPEILSSLRANARKTALAFRWQDILPRHAMRLVTAYRQWKNKNPGSVS